MPKTGDYRIEAIGAAGGYDNYNSNSRHYRGRGARMKGTFRLSRGETIQILVGQEGGINNVRNAAGGGGGTFVVRGSRTSFIIAEGGGGIEALLSRRTGCDASTGRQVELGTNHGQEEVGDTEQRPLTMTTQVKKNTMRACT